MDVHLSTSKSSRFSISATIVTIPTSRIPIHHPNLNELCFLFQSVIPINLMFVILSSDSVYCNSLNLLSLYFYVDILYPSNVIFLVVPLGNLYRCLSQTLINFISHSVYTQPTLCCSSLLNSFSSPVISCVTLYKLSHLQVSMFSKQRACKRKESKTCYYHNDDVSFHHRYFPRALCP